MRHEHGARRVRAGAFAASAVGLALGAHLAAGGAMPVLPLLLLLVALSEAVSSAFARRRRGPVPTAVALVSSQVVLHLAFGLAAPHHHGLPEGMHDANLPMVIGHGIAALVLAGMLSHGDLVLERLADSVLPIVVVAPFRLPASRAEPVATPLDRTPSRIRAVFPHDLSRRGPPGCRTAARA